MSGSQFKCPAETTHGMAPMSCVMTCPNEFELQTVDGAQRCVSKIDKNVSVLLVSQTAITAANGDDTILKISDLDPASDAGMRYRAESERFNAELVTARASISHADQVSAAAAALQNAAPGAATTAAKAAYMALTGDADDVAYDLDQNAKTEAEKMTDRFASEYRFLSNQSYQQQSTLDLINSVKDNIFTVKDDMEFSVSTFDKQVNDIRNQINLNKRQREQAADYGKWLSMALNIAIVFALVFAIFVVGRKAMGTMGSSGSGSSQGAPARAPATPETAEFFDAFLKHLTPASGASAKRGWFW